MTFRQVLQILWRGRWIGLAIIVIVMTAAAAYATTQTPTYTSQVTYRVNPLVSSGTLTGDAVRDQVDFEIDTLRSPAILEPVADQLGVSASELRSGISYEVRDGLRTDRLIISATANSPEEAQAWATAVGEEYAAYLENETANGLADLMTRQEQLLADTNTYQRQRDADPDDALASANLATAISQLGTLNRTIETIQLAGPALTLMTPASTPSQQGTSMASILVVAFVAGFILACAVVLIIDQFDDRIKDESEFDALTDLPVLGSVPLDKKLARKKSTELPAAMIRESALNESLRSLRTALQVLLPTERAVVVFTSVEPGDGKTLISSNLALTWQRSGKRVILVGGDLRKPNLPFDKGNRDEGLAQLLQRAAANRRPPSTNDIEAALHSTDFPGLHVLPAGARPVNPSDLLATEYVPHIIAALSDLADIVVIDAPPAMGLADAALLGEHASGVVVVSSIYRTHRDELVKTLQVLGSSRARLLGLIANRSRQELPDGYGSYYFDSSAGDPTPATITEGVAHTVAEADDLWARLAGDEKK